jgi:hypothetical protein
MEIDYQGSVMKKIEGLGTEKVLAHVEDGIGWLQFNNAEKHNALSLEMSGASVSALAAFAADRDVRVVVQSLRSAFLHPRFHLCRSGGTLVHRLPPGFSALGNGCSTPAASRVNYRAELMAKRVRQAEACGYPVQPARKS